MAAPPDLDGRGKSQQNNARRPSEETAFGEQGPYLVDTLGEEKAKAREQAGVKGLTPAPATITRAQRLARVKTQEALSLRASGWSMSDIAEALEVSVATVTKWFTEHRHAVKSGRIDRDLDQIAVPLAKENLIHGLLAGDKDYTLETLKGRGQFRRHVAQESHVQHELPPLVIQFVGAPSAAIQAGEKLVTGTVVGTKALPAPAETTRTETLDVPVGVGVPSRPHGSS